MTLEEAKEQIAEKHGLRQWSHVEHYNIEEYMEQAAEIYARSKWDEACEAQRKSCYDSWKHEEFGQLSSSILNAPKPEFKP